MQRRHPVPWLVFSLILLACGAPAGAAIVKGEPLSAEASKLARSSNAFGFEAAAATAVMMKLRGGYEAPARQLKVDRPFLFLIRDNASGLILFLGRVSDPIRR